ncbi:MAG: hypothetical protein PV344_00745, partial [Anaplasma sp.]|nr:hypothetical protein [Anaplasma sp.]
MSYFLCWKNPKNKIPSQSYSAFAFGNKGEHMLSRINKGLGFQVFEGSTDEGPNNKLPSLHIPESARNLGVVVGVCCFAVLLFSSLLYVVYWISMALCVVSALFLFIDYVVAASAYLAASKDFL